MSEIKSEIESGMRFEFGENWRKFLNNIDENRITQAQNSLKQMLSLNSLEGKTFLDIGCGSGLFSLAAKRLGAKVRSLDYDPEAVVCANELKKRFLADDMEWTIEQGSALDTEYIKALGEYDIVYSWGVLHHTGDMAKALVNAALPVKKDGLLFIAIYNKQPILSAYWLGVKKLYNKVPAPGKFMIASLYFLYSAGGMITMDILRGKNPLSRVRGTNRRGMSLYTDAIDWVGGLPFEVAAPEEIISLYRDSGFSLVESTTCGGKHGCNEFVFRRSR